MTRAAVLTNYNDPLQIWPITWEPIGFGQVRVDVIASGICGAQLQEIQGFKGNHLPRLMGHEGVGVVLETGHGVKTVKVGEKVVLHWRKGEGIESDFPQWNYPTGRTTAGLCTTWSTQTIVSENRCTAVPLDTPDELCVLLGCGLSTALGTVENELDLRLGQRLLIIGCGGVGMNLVLAGRLRGASVICVLDQEEEKEELAKNLGATHFTSDWEHLSAKFDAIVDTTGNVTAIENGLKLVEEHGTFVMIGQPKPRQNVTLSNACHLVYGAKRIIGTQGGMFNPAQDIPRYVSLFRSNGINPGDVISHRLSLSQINEGINLVRSGKAGRILIEL